MKHVQRSPIIAGEDRLAVVADLAHALVTTTDLNELLTRIVTATGDVLKFDDCILYLWNRTRQKLVQRAAYGPKLDPEDGRVLNAIELDLDQGIVGAVARSQKPEVISDVRNDPRYVSDIEGTLSEITVPIVYRGSLIGVIDAESFELGAFTQDDLAILTTFANLCASALITLNHLKRERAHANRALASSEARYRDVVELSSDMIYTTTPDGVVDYVNPACQDLLGVDCNEVIGRPIVDFISEPNRAQMRTHLKKIREADKPRIVIELPMTNASQSQVLTEQTISATWSGPSDRTELVGYQAIVRDVTRHAALQRSLRDQANHDPLTGLLSRRGFESEFDTEFQRANRAHGQCVLFWIDVDEFKKINDVYGHAVGDNVLRRIASVFREHTRHEDAVARFGGDEFMILMRGCDVDAAEATAGRINRSVHDTVGPELDLPRSVTVSIGIVARRLSDHYPENMMARADEALYAAKLAGRNCYRLHRDELGTLDGTEAFNEDREELERGLVENRFDLYAQPILDLTTGRVTHYELLLRYHGSDGRVVLPADVLAVAERSTLIRQIDRWVVQRTVEILKSGQLPKGTCVEANLSGRAFSDPELLEYMKVQIQELGSDASRLIIEITESSAVANLDEAHDFINELQALGCHFAIDDFGVGYSSFHYLKHLPASYVKIDGSFIKNLPTSPTDQHLVRCIVDVARGLGKRTVAEFVDQRESLILLRELGVDLAQGYYIGRPRPLATDWTGNAEQETPVADFDWSSPRRHDGPTNNRSVNDRARRGCEVNT